MVLNNTTRNNNCSCKVPNPSLVGVWEAASSTTLINDYDYTTARNEQLHHKNLYELKSILLLHLGILHRETISNDKTLMKLN